MAIKGCDGAYDGKFWYGLKTTKRFCRPSCPKHSYDPKNILIFQSAEEAADKGFHPCSRCHPELPDWAGTKPELAHSAQKLIRESYAQKFSLEAVANTLHINKYYLLRIFKSETGMTLLEYHNFVRCKEAEALLQSQEYSISMVASMVGYVSASHFTQVFRRITGLTPSEYRRSYLKSLDE